MSDLLTVGCDPGESVEESTFVMDDQTYGFEELLDYDGIRAVVVEIPVPQGDRAIKKGPMFRTCTTVGFLAGVFWSRGVRVYTPSRLNLMSQAGVKGGDKELLQHFVGIKRLHGQYKSNGALYCTTPGFGTTHARAALLASMFNWQHPSNQKYLYRVPLC